MLLSGKKFVCDRIATREDEPDHPGRDGDDKSHEDIRVRIFAALLLLFFIAVEAGCGAARRRRCRARDVVDCIGHHGLITEK